MKRMLFISVMVSFVVAACTGEGPATIAPEPAVDQEQEIEAPAEDTGTETEGESQPELVEESAAEPEDEQAEDQPILLARDAEPAKVAARDWQYSEGRHYHRLVPTQPTVGGADKIEVAEIFWYGCPHCYSFEPAINKWAESIPQNARFIRIPAVWNPLARLHGRLYYTQEVLARNGKLADADGMHTAVFNEFHVKGNRLTSEGSIQKLFGQFGVSAEDFYSTWNSFEVNQKVRVADDLVRRYNVTGVPAIVVNGKFRTGAGPNDAGSTANLLKVMDELISRETIR